MAKILINTTTVGTVKHWAGDTINDAVVAAAIEAAGGIVVDGAVYPTIATVAATALAMRKRSQFRDAESLMLAAFVAAAGDIANLGSVVASILRSTTAGQGASGVALQDAGGFFATKNVEAALQALAAGSVGTAVQKVTTTITQAADLAGLGAGVKTFDKNVGAALPSNARILAVTAESVTDFDDATHGTYTVVVGTSAGGNQVGTSLNVAAGQTGFPKGFAAGAQGYSMAPQGGAQVSARLTSSVDLNTATAGAITVNVFYVVLA